MTSCVAFLALPSDLISIILEFSPSSVLKLLSSSFVKKNINILEKEILTIIMKSPNIWKHFSLYFNVDINCISHQNNPSIALDSIPIPSTSCSIYYQRSMLDNNSEKYQTSETVQTTKTQSELTLDIMQNLSPFVRYSSSFITNNMASNFVNNTCNSVKDDNELNVLNFYITDETINKIIGYWSTLNRNQKSRFDIGLPIEFMKKFHLFKNDNSSAISEIINFLAEYLFIKLQNRYQATKNNEHQSILPSKLPFFNCLQIDMNCFLNIQRNISINSANHECLECDLTTVQHLLLNNCNLIKKINTSNERTIKSFPNIKILSFVDCYLYRNISPPSSTLSIIDSIIFSIPTTEKAYNNICEKDFFQLLSDNKYFPRLETIIIKERMSSLETIFVHFFVFYIFCNRIVCRFR